MPLVSSPVRPGKTRIGYSSPSEPILAPAGDIPPRAENEVAAAIEVVLVEQHGPPAKKSAWRSLEIWTRNRVYSLDEHGTCIEVLDRVAGRPDDEHALLGSQLAGGQRREGQKLKLSHPYPVPGTEAVFRLPAGRAGRFGQTSKVERVVLRVRIAEMTMPGAQTDWDVLAASVGLHSPDEPAKR